MGRTVRDVALLLGTLAGIDPDDKASAASRGKTLSDYTKCLDAKGLKGAKIGVVRKLFGFNDGVDAVLEEALAVMKRQGATLVDPAEIRTLGQFDDTATTVLLYEFKADLNAYLERLGPRAPVRSLKDIISFNERNRKKTMPYFGQDTFLKAEAKGPLTAKEYLEALEKNRRLSRSEGIDATMDKLKLDALVAPTSSPAWLTDLVNGDGHVGGGGSTTPAAVAGYPHISVPASLPPPDPFFSVT